MSAFWRHPLRTARDVMHTLRDVDARVARIDARLRAIEAREDPRDLRESLDAISRRAAFGRGPVRVVFLVHLVEAWDSCHDVWSAMVASEDFTPVVVSIPRHFNGDDGPGGEADVHRGLERAGVEHLRLPVSDLGEAGPFLQRLEPDLVFRQSQWDADVPAACGTDRLGFVRTALIPYETMNIVRNVPNEVAVNSAVDSPYHRAAWVVFCANDLMLEMARTDGAYRGAQFRVAGHPKADRIRAASPAWPVTPAAPGPERRPRIAWSAHHSIGTGWVDFGAFPAMAPDMLAWALECPDVEFAFLPHPALRPYTNAPGSPLTQAEYDAWLARWSALPNTAVSADGGYPAVLAASDVLVTDGLSLLLECQLLERPIVFVEREGHRPFNEIGELVRRGAHPATDVRSARAVVDELLRSDSDPLADQQRANVARLFGDTPSVHRIMAILRGMVAAERA